MEYAVPTPYHEQGAKLRIATDQPRAAKRTAVAVRARRACETRRVHNGKFANRVEFERYVRSEARRVAGMLEALERTSGKKV